MKITPVLPPSSTTQYDVAVRRRTVAETFKSDKVEFSQAAQSFVNTVKAVKDSLNAPSAEALKRARRISEQITSGNYAVDADLVADKILSGARFDGEA